MKKVQIVFGILCIATMSAVAQIKVDTYGDVHIGSTTITPYDTQGDLIIGQDGPENSLTFYNGSGSSFRIFRGTPTNSIVYLTRGGSLTAGMTMNAAGNIGIKNAPHQDYSLYIAGSAYYTNNTYISSDIRNKTNVNPLKQRITFNDSLLPMSYNYKIKKKNYRGSDTTGVYEYQTDSIDTNVSFGFIAQEVQKYYPNLVKADDNGILALNYDGFIPILWESNIELRAKNRELENRIERLERGNGNGHLKSETVTEQQENSVFQTTVLHQNFPNPWNTSTEITMILDSKVTNAMLCIYDMTGKQIKCYTITSRGNTQVTIHAEELQPGMYMYSLIADGTLIDTKKMVLTE